MTRGWRPQGIRHRLTLWYVAAMAVILSLYAAGVFLFLRGTLGESLDTLLHEDFEITEGLLVRSGGLELAWVRPPHDEPGEAADRAIEVWDGGELKLGFPGASPPMADVARPPPRMSAYDYASAILADGSHVRTLTGPVRVGGTDLVMRISRSEEPMRQELRELALVLGLTWPAALALAGVGGYLLARRALAPVDLMAERARSITADRLDERLPVENPHDELGRLAIVFNDTLARIDDAFARLKRFTADASHELRTPLTAMRSVGEVGLREPRDPAAYRDVIGSMLEEVDRLTRLVETLLMLSRADAGRAQPVLEPVALDALAREVSAHLAVLAEEKRQTLSVNGDAGATVIADRALLRSALVNLVDNAIKHGPADAEIAIEIARGADETTIAVSDQGPGIAPADRALVFERFYRVDAARSRELGGTGLGLAIAKWAVEASGGRIELTSREGEGSTFRIALPKGRD